MASGGAEELSPVAQLVSERSGSSLSPQQIFRLHKLLAHKTEAQDEPRYAQHLRTRAGAAELQELMSAVAVHKTDLFRDIGQLEAFLSEILVPLAAQGRPLHLWSAGCATGEEVATLLALLAEANAHPGSTVVGSDLSAHALRRAARLRFPLYQWERVPTRFRRHFTVEDGEVVLSRELGARARFVIHNLIDLPYPAPPQGAGFDVIFCRNVLIYFTEQAFDRVVGLLAARLVPAGTLVLSAAEPIVRPQPSLATRYAENAFFYVRRPSSPPPEELAPPAAQRVWLRPLPPVRGAVTPSAKREGLFGLDPALDPKEEASRLFHAALESAARGAADGFTESALRQALYLDPHLAQARYLLGMLLEQRGEGDEAAKEYRRAIGALRDGHVRTTPFFLRNDRLLVACRSALTRIGYGAE